MHSRLTCLITWSLALIVTAAAETPVATISSSAQFEIRGVQVPVAGVPSWPVVRGDVIATGASNALVSFSDSSQATVEKDSRIEIQREDGHTILKLLRGSLLMRWSPSSTLKLQAADRPIAMNGASPLKVSVTGAASSPEIAVSRGERFTLNAKPPPPPPPPPVSPHQ